MRSTILFSCLAATTLAAVPATLRWEALPAIPDREGFAGSFAGASGTALIVAGGANFPYGRPWEGGTKVWHDRVFVLEPGAAAWREGGRLPRANGYGVSIPVHDGVLFIGGGDAKANFAEVLHARWDGKTVRFSTAWPALPQPLAMSAGARNRQFIYIAGGLDRPDATEAQQVSYVLDLDHVSAGWRETPRFPGPARFLATAAVQGEGFSLFSGAKLVPGPDGKAQREWLRDAWHYAPTMGWKRLADLPRAAAAAPSLVVNEHVFILGGDDGTQATTTPTEHRGFPRGVLVYDPKANSWARGGELPFSLVTTTPSTWGGRVVIPGGETRPGVRSTAVWAGRLSTTR